MNKEKENEFALAELGDTLMQEKLKLEAELKMINKKIDALEKQLGKGKPNAEDNNKMNTFFMKFIVANRGFAVMRRLEEIKKQIEK